MTIQGKQDAIYPGYVLPDRDAIFKALHAEAMLRTTLENVDDVMDAVRRVARRAEPSVAADERALNGLPEILREASSILAGESPLRGPIVDELHGFASIVEEYRAALASPAVSQKDGAARTSGDLCPNCGGEGMDGEPGDEPGTGNIWKCGTCNGTGRASASRLGAVEQAWQLGLRADHRGYADLRAALARAPLPAQEPIGWASRRLDNGEYGSWLHRSKDMAEKHNAGNGPAAPKYEHVPVFAAPAQAGDAQDAARLLCQLVKSEVGKQTLWRLSDGIGTDTDEGRAWLKAKELAASIDAAMSASQGQGDAT